MFNSNNVIKLWKCTIIHQKYFGTIKMICIVKKILPDLYLPATDLLILYN